ncbi:hypothetical protein P171DRAFT_482085 [Karstenula rhodostoma CBS 690.94]|uniref:Uncharacterized protein n=1 Tax=Karstenula rhodostoma CBS 690.94 TaxID=1392251 RepID=A0A9P4PRW6_9PLEO|nr:hypothetical protein P171DRAFT_482085 [Karstenula rhodostoma CBS 690.94]
MLDAKGAISERMSEPLNWEKRLGHLLKCTDYVTPIVQPVPIARDSNLHDKLVDLSSIRGSLSHNSPTGLDTFSITPSQHARNHIISSKGSTLDDRATRASSVPTFALQTSPPGSTIDVPTGSTGAHPRSEFEGSSSGSLQRKRKSNDDESEYESFRAENDGKRRRAKNTGQCDTGEALWKSDREEFMPPPGSQFL